MPNQKSLNPRWPSQVMPSQNSVSQPDLLDYLFAIFAVTLSDLNPPPALQLRNPLFL